MEIPKFVKWAGGKTQLIDQFIPLFPKKFNRYLEPFVGSGAVFFYIIQTFKPSESIISDINEELMNAYQVVKENVDELIIELKKHKQLHVAEGKPYYLSKRSTHPNDLPAIERAARFIYLNKTCFNGLYRVNSKGQFNVPMGKYTNPDIIQEDKLKLISKLIKNTTIKTMSFEKVVDMAQKGDFLYLDPPYYPIQKGRSFTTYTKDNFLEKEQEALAEVFRKLNKKGCLVMESNSETDFIKGLYKDFNITVVKAKRMINSDSTKRGEINEFVIRNY